MGPGKEVTRTIGCQRKGIVGKLLEQRRHGCAVVLPGCMLEAKGARHQQGLRLHNDKGDVCSHEAPDPAVRPGVHSD